MRIKIKSPKYGIHYVLVDKEDMKLFDKTKLYLHHVGQFLYVRVNPSKISLHRLIMGIPQDKVIDHINRDTLDNRKSNLRICTIQENLRNQKRPNNKTGKTGVSIAYGGKYSAQIKHNYKKIHLGIFDNLKSAIQARKDAELKYWGSGEATISP